MGNRVKAVRLYLGLSSLQMAHILKIDEFDVLAWENGRAIPQEYAERIAQQAQIDVRFVLGTPYKLKRRYEDLQSDEKRDIDALKTEAKDVVRFLHLGGHFED